METGEFVGAIDINQMISWSHLTCTYDNKRAVIYLNGIQKWECEIKLI